MAFSITKPKLELNPSIYDKKPAFVCLIMTRHVDDRSSPVQELCSYENIPLLLQQQTLWFLSSLADIFQIFAFDFLHIRAPFIWSFQTIYTRPLFDHILNHCLQQNLQISSFYAVRLNINLSTELRFLKSSSFLRYSVKLCKCTYFFILPFMLCLLAA